MCADLVVISHKNQLVVIVETFIKLPLIMNSYVPFEDIINNRLSQTRNDLDTSVALVDGTALSAYLTVLFSTLYKSSKCLSQNKFTMHIERIVKEIWFSFYIICRHF